MGGTEVKEKVREKLIESSDGKGKLDKKLSAVASFAQLLTKLMGAPKNGKWGEWLTRDKRGL